MAGVLSLGFSAIFIRWAAAPGVVSAFYRMAVASAVVAVPFAFRMIKGSWPPWSAIRLAILGGIFFAADLAAWATGVMISGATNPTLLGNTAPLWVGLGTMLLFRQKLKPIFWIGTIVALLGAALVVGLEQEGKAIGSILGLIAGFFFAGYFLVTQLGREKLDSLSYFGLAALSSAAVLLLLNRGLGQPLTGYPPTTYAVFIAMGVITQVFGYFTISFALGYLPASIVSPVMLGQPVVTAILAGLLLGEALGSSQIVGGLAVLAGVFLVVRSQ